jgi:hypothetical protein
VLPGGDRSQQSSSSDEQASSSGRDSSTCTEQQQQQGRLCEEGKEGTCTSSGRFAACAPDEPCPVCHEGLQPGTVVVELPCKHCFHEECLLPWFQEVRRGWGRGIRRGDVKGDMKGHRERHAGGHGERHMEGRGKGPARKCQDAKPKWQNTGSK